MAPPFRSPSAAMQRFVDAMIRLFRRISSLFCRELSLFDLVGNSIKKGNQSY
jgi:hypothetical protein